jgi:hypothetical protein
VNCTNCEGTGIATYRYGPPGTDRHAPASEVEWEEPRHRECRACVGTGQRKQSRHGPAGKVWFELNGDVDQERTTNERHRASRAKGNQGWITKTG